VRMCFCPALLVTCLIALNYILPHKNKIKINRSALPTLRQAATRYGETRSSVLEHRWLVD
jgi:hypothetical protein